MMDILAGSLALTAKIVASVTVFMIIIEYLEVRYSKVLTRLLVGRKITQILFASLLGAVPGCFDAFLVVSLYIHGLVGFSALVAVMLSTAGDEAFVMLALFPEAAVKIMALLVVLGALGGLLAEALFRDLHLKAPCAIEVHETAERGHFLREHVWGHILRGHVPRLVLWVYVPLVVTEALIRFYDLGTLIQGYPVYILMITAALVGMIPGSGPHMFFVFFYANGLIPFSVLMVNTLSQDGHGLLPLLSHSLRDTVYVQLFTTLFSLILGLVLLLIGL